MNHVIIEGTLPRAPYTRDADDKSDALALFSVRARNRGGRPNFPPIKANDDLAILAKDQLTKGTKVRIEGYIETSKWTSDDGGEPQYRVEVVATSIEALAGARRNTRRRTTKSAA